MDGVSRGCAPYHWEKSSFPAVIQPHLRPQPTGSGCIWAPAAGTASATDSQLVSAVSPATLHFSAVRHRFVRVRLPKSSFLHPSFLSPFRPPAGGELQNRFALSRLFCQWAKRNEVKGFLACYIIKIECFSWEPHFWSHPVLSTGIKYQYFSRATNPPVFSLCNI